MHVCFSFCLLLYIWHYGPIFSKNRINFLLEHKLFPCHQQRLLQVYWKTFTCTTDGIVVEKFILCNILYILQFILFCFIYSYGIVILLMLCIKFCFALFYSIPLCLFNYTLMLWVIMLWYYVMYLSSYVMADGIAIFIYLFYFTLFHFLFIQTYPDVVGDYVWGYMVYLASYVLAEGIDKLYFYYINVADVIVTGVRCY